MTNQPDPSTIDLPPAALADLPEALQRGAARAGWAELMPVQARAVPGRI
jgi:ATP-dependent RNA helicase DeaD